MQSSLDHDASGQVAVDVEDPMENAPLLGRAPSRSFKAWASMAFLFLVLVVGVSIGAYLLVAQNREEDIVPMTTLKKFSDYDDFFAQKDFRPKFILLKAGVTRDCVRVDDCVKIMEEMENSVMPGRDLNPFHILTMTDGRLLFGHKYDSRLDLIPDVFTIAIIGNFTYGRMPNKYQIDSISRFISYHDGKGHFDPQYVTIMNMHRKFDNHHLDLLENIPHYCGDCTIV